MQTFIPFTDHNLSAFCLDRLRLGKQRVETLQILNALSGKSRGWVNHPATKMWRGHELALVEYGIIICAEWTNRGYKDTCADKIWDTRGEFKNSDWNLPDWWGRKEIHDSHRSRLMQKDYDYYIKFGWKVPLDLDYVWPV